MLVRRALALKAEEVAGPTVGVDAEDIESCLASK